MTETQSYIIDVIKLIPDNSICFVQAPDIEESSALRNLLNPDYNRYFERVILSPANKKTLVEIIKYEEVEVYFQSIKIRNGSKLYFEGYDGMDCGIISKDVILPDRFIKHYINEGMCIVSNEW